MSQDSAHEQPHWFCLQTNTGLWELVKKLVVDEVSGASAKFLDKNAHWQLAHKLRDWKRLDWKSSTINPHTLWLPQEKNNSNTDVTSHTSLFLVWHLQPMNCTLKKIQKNSVHYKILDLIWLLLTEKRYCCILRKLIPKRARTHNVAAEPAEVVLCWVGPVHLLEFWMERIHPEQLGESHLLSFHFTGYTHDIPCLTRWDLTCLAFGVYHKCKL